MISKIDSLDHVKLFVHQLVQEGINYHPDDDFCNYVNMESGDVTYSSEEAAARNRLNRQCFEICSRFGEDIYSISQEIFLIETGLDKFIPLPSSIH